MTGPLLELEDLRITFPGPNGPLEAVRGVSFAVGRERLASSASRARASRLPVAPSCGWCRGRDWSRPAA